jgi:RsiW-degrading membrane proteinase PrsW (M82 family)
MPFPTILILLVILFVIATVPVWPYSRAWGFWPSGVAALLLVALLGYLVMGTPLSQ